MYKIAVILFFCTGALFAQNTFTACKEAYGSGIFYDKCTEDNIEKLKEFEKNTAKKNGTQDEETKKLKNNTENSAKNIKKLESEMEKLQKEIKELKNDILTLKKEVEKLKK